MKVSCNVSLSVYRVATMKGKGKAGTPFISRSDMRVRMTLVSHIYVAAIPYRNCSG